MSKPRVLMKKRTQQIESRLDVLKPLLDDSPTPYLAQRMSELIDEEIDLKIELDTLTDELYFNRLSQDHG